jgi:predicted RNase H-like HicB family nuclease
MIITIDWQEVDIVIEWSKQDAVYVSWFPELPGCNGRGATVDEAVAQSRAAASALFASRRNEALGEVLEMLGGTADITEEDMKQVEDEWREHGLIK